VQSDPLARIADPTGAISIADYGEICEWCKRLGCTEIELAEAIALVGYSPERVRVFLASATRTPHAGQ